MTGRMRLQGSNKGDNRRNPVQKVEQVVDTAGSPLAPAVRSRMEVHFGHDFSEVRVHADGGAAESAMQLNANAYTFGNDIVFGTAKYQPDTPKGKELLAHELTHVIQQDGFEKSLSKVDIADRTEASEQEARHMSHTLQGSAAYVAGPSTRIAMGEGVLQRDETLPETTISISPAEHAVWQAGYEDAMTGKRNDPISRGFGPSQDYVDGYEAGSDDARRGIKKDDSDVYDGPSVGPGPSNEELEDMKKQDELRKERQELIHHFLGELGQEDPDKKEPEDPTRYLPEIPEVELVE